MRCSFIPPYLLERIAGGPDPTLGDCASRTLETDRGHRESRAAATTGLPSGPSAGRPSRTVAAAHHTTQLPGSVVRREGDPSTGDAAVDEAYGWLGATYTFYLDAYDRDSTDGAGAPLNATVRYGQEYDNAFWNGHRMVYGDGDGKVFRRFTIPVGVTAHELTHGVTQHTAKLAYENQPGALNESVSDVFASLVKQYDSEEPADRADWLIGEGLFTSDVQGVALRSLKAPGTAYDDPRIGKDPQPSTMSGYVRTAEDNGGVHINSGIPSHAFYLAATALGGNAWERAGLVWYRALLDSRLTPSADFATFANLTIQVAGELFGASGAEVRALRDAWTQVEVTDGRGGGSGATVSVTRSGGITGIVVRAEIDVGDRADAEEWTRLIRDADLDHVRPHVPAPDRFVYRIDIGDTHVSVGEAELTGPIRRLIDRVLTEGTS
ncbi:MAG: protealysin inhibitor emfourin [Streptosporangiaceae bacterium]